MTMTAGSIEEDVMARRQKEIKVLVKSVIEDDLGLVIEEFGIRKGSTHQYARVTIDGVQRDLSFSLSPSKTVRRGGLRSDFKKRLRMWGHDIDG